MNRRDKLIKAIALAMSDEEMNRLRTFVSASEHKDFMEFVESEMSRLKARLNDLLYNGQARPALQNYRLRIVTAEIIELKIMIIRATILLRDAQKAQSKS